MSECSDFTELDFSNQYELIRSAYQISGQVKKYVKSMFRHKENYIVNDYIKQGEKIDHSAETVKKLSIDQVTEDRYLYLEKIVSFARKNHLNLVYLHGPCYEKIVEQSQEYIESVNQKISHLGLNVVKHVVAVPNDDLGDSDDHIIPTMKTPYTKKYMELIRLNEIESEM